MSTRVSRLTSCQCVYDACSTSSNRSEAAEDLAGVDALVGAAHDLDQAAYPRDPLVEEVPGQGEVTAGAQHARDLRQRAVVVEPVEGLRGDDDVDAVVVGGDLLRSGDLGADLGHPVLEDLEHRLVGLGREDRMALVDDLAGQLAGARAELEDDLRLAVHQPGDGLGGIGRAGRGRRRPPRPRRSGTGAACRAARQSSAQGYKRSRALTVSDGPRDAAWARKLPRLAFPL